MTGASGSEIDHEIDVTDVIRIKPRHSNLGPGAKHVRRFGFSALDVERCGTPMARRVEGV
jgi:hypothetical protein